ncbi:MAG: putative addiction module antidote protein [Treponema sp.]|nr:putative addiction module antidote protein [Treponema sp.]
MKLTKFNILDHLKNEEEIQAFIQVALDDEDPAFIPIALAEVARARKAMAKAAKAAGVARTSLYQSLSAEGRPAFDTVAKVAHSLGYKITLVPIA